MTAHLSCEALRDDIIALLYDDGEAAERSRARDHIARCLPCRAEYAELKGVRTALGGWTLPASAPLPQGKSPLRWFPTALAAAAGLVLGIGVALAGRNALSPQSAVETAAQSANSSSSAEASRFVSHDELQGMLRTQESRYLAEIGQLRETLASLSETASNSPGARPVLTLSSASFEKLLRASEERQARMFEARLTGLRSENELQRQYDMAQIAAGLAYIDSRTGADAARTSELMKNLVRVTAKPQDR